MKSSCLTLVFLSQVLILYNNIHIGAALHTTSVDKLKSCLLKLHFKLISTENSQEVLCKEKNFEKALQRNPLTRIILMIQIRGNRLLTIIKVDVIIRNVRAITKIWETLISHPLVCKKLKPGLFNCMTLRHKTRPILENIKSL